MKRIAPLFFSFALILFLLLTIRCSSSKPDDPAPAVSLIPQFPDLKVSFNAAYVAPTGFQDLAATLPTADGKPVRVIKDLIGDKDLTWVGVDVPSPMWPTPPVYHIEGKTGYILVHNVFSTKWASKQFAAIPQPFDLYVVLRDLECVNYEGYFAVSLGLRNRGDHLEISVSDAVGKTTAKDLSSPTILEFNKISIVRMRFDGANSKVWINGSLVAPGVADTGTGAISQLGYGTVSHAAQHDFFGMWVKFGTIPDSDHAAIYQTLSDYYGPGQYPGKPLAKNIKAVWNGSTKSWDAQYEFVGDGINLEDPTKTEYQWGYWDKSKDLNTSSLFAGDNSKKKSLKRSDFPDIINLPGKATSSIGVSVFAIVKVYDTKGNFWEHLVRSPHTLDNTP